jgi:hypothetical protein
MISTSNIRPCFVFLAEEVDESVCTKIFLFLCQPIAESEKSKFHVVNF